MSANLRGLLTKQIADIEDFNRGFSLDRDGSRRLKGLAPLSLRIALHSFFSTYREMRHHIGWFERWDDDLDIQKVHSTDYKTLYCQTILFFHHFIELILKDALSEEHQLLALNISQSHVILHKLINNEQLDDDEMRKIKTEEFSDSLKGLCSLIKKNRIKNQSWYFIKDAEGWLEKLNSLRNRIWHKGTFILWYPALDRIVGKYILPFVIRVVEMPRYKDFDAFWRYKPLQCGIDPISIIIEDIANDKYDIKKIAFIKELGRAAYENPLFNDRFRSELNIEHQNRAEASAKADLQSGWMSGSEIRDCPVCGAKSLVLYDDVEADQLDPQTGSYGRAWRYTYRARCSCCTFEVDNHLDNPGDYGVDIDDFWTAEDI